ncbi:hypothetical protein Taro_022534 [Colocasia esculenta]|uniref:Uncharacterized protein n=1 Tax=Colocasia esculenta TaxID=4460 RepID=A0A843V8M3_COLES|nr:hypothetical protein [Colocasia esculenta]
MLSAGNIEVRQENFCSTISFTSTSKNVFLRLSSRRDRLRAETHPCSRSILGEDRRLRRTEFSSVRL